MGRRKITVVTTACRHYKMYKVFVVVQPPEDALDFIRGRVELIECTLSPYHDLKDLIDALSQCFILAVKPGSNLTTDGRHDLARTGDRINNNR